MHNARYQRVSATNDLAQIAADYRKNLVNPYTGRNIMVYEYIDEARNLAVSAPMISRGKHTEKRSQKALLSLEFSRKGKRVERAITTWKNCFPMLTSNISFHTTTKPRGFQVTQSRATTRSYLVTFIIAAE